MMEMGKNYRRDIAYNIIFGINSKNLIWINVRLRESSNF